VAEAALIMLLPLLDGGTGAAVARHWAGESTGVVASY